MHVHAHFNFALLRKFYGVFSTYKNKSFVKTCRHMPLSLPPPPWPQLFDQPPIPNRRCRHHRATAKLPPTSRCRAAATAATALLLPRYQRRAVRRCHRRCRCRRRSAAVKLSPTSRYRAAAIASPPPSCRRPCAVALPPPLLPCRRLLVGCCVVITLPPPPCRRQAAADVALSRCRHRLAAAKLPTTSRCRAVALSRCRAAAAAIAAAAAAAPPFVGWLLLCCPSSDFVVITKKRFL